MAQPFGGCNAEQQYVSLKTKGRSCVDVESPRAASNNNNNWNFVTIEIKTKMIAVGISIRIKRTMARSHTGCLHRRRNERDSYSLVMLECGEHLEDRYVMFLRHVFSFVQERLLQKQTNKQLTVINKSIFFSCITLLIFSVSAAFCLEQMINDTCF